MTKPIVEGGSIDIDVDGDKKTINITRAHLEEDAGKSIHDAYPDKSVIDLNRAGTPCLRLYLSQKYLAPKKLFLT